MPFTSINKSKVIRIAAYMLVCYVLCCLLDYMFFDYDLGFIWGKWVISCSLMASFVLVCLAMGRTGYVVFTLFCFCSSILAYAHHIFGYELTYDGVAALFETNARELCGFMSFALVSILVLAVLAPVGLFYLLRKLIPLRTGKIRLIAGSGAAAVFVFFFNLPVLMYAVRPSIYQRTCSLTHKALPEMFETGHYELSSAHLRVPFSMLKAATEMAYVYLTEPTNFTPIEESASQCDEKLQEELIIVLVIGESIRADHCTFNGYARPTMEDVSKVPGVVVLPDMWSYGPSTYVSLEGIFGGLHVPESSATHTSFVGLFRKHGYYTRFVAENTADSLSGRKLRNLAGYAFEQRESRFMPIVDLAQELGGDLRKHYPKGCLLVVENGTGHFPYAVEEPNRKFRPDHAGHSDMNADCERAINDYDNCVYSVNRFLATLLEHLKDKKAVLIYCSDHGQRLGEGGSWAHGVACKEVQHVGAFIWFSPAYEAACPEYVAALKSAATQPHCHGQLFATLLRLGGITTEAPLLTPDLSQPAPDAAPIHLSPSVVPEH